MYFDMAISPDQYPNLLKYTRPVKRPERDILGRDVELKRIMAAMNRPELCNVMLLAEAGSGKALANDTLIPVADDRKFVSMGELMVGDMVFNEEHEAVRVSHVFPKGKLHAYVIHLANGQVSPVCNDDHLWGVYEHDQFGLSYHVHTLREMMDIGLYDRGAYRFGIPKIGSIQEYCLGGVVSDNEKMMPVESVEDLGYETEMTCIYVDTPNHLFLAGEQEMVTHNTALVQGTMMSDKVRYYLEVDLASMIADCNIDVNQMADKLTKLFNEVQTYCDKMQVELVLFMDEFHQVVQLSPAAVEALKPLLADSGTRGIRIIVATTYIEFRKWIAPNQPLVERLQRINLTEPDKDTVVDILANMAKRYGVDAQFYDKYLFEQIYDLTQRYIPSNAQPRKSILIFDAMIGWYRYDKRRLNMRLLTDVLYESEGINTAFRVDATKIKEELDAHVFAQQAATTVIENRLQICVADLNNKNRPMSSFLFCGSTGVGKTEMAKQLSRILFNDERRLLRFDMSEFAEESSMERFRKELTQAVWERPYSIVLLDEIEKSCRSVTRLLLQVLDDGRLMDENNREVPFTNCYIILTTNAGNEVFKNIAQYDASDTGDGEGIEKYQSLILESIRTTQGEKFPAELLGRIDTIVPFQPLSVETQSKIIRTKLYNLRAEVRKKHNVVLEFSSDVVDYIVLDNSTTDSDAGGARAVISKMEIKITSLVSAYINRHPKVRRLLVSIEGEMKCRNKNLLKSTAYVKVSEMGGGQASVARTADRTSSDLYSNGYRPFKRH